jgi:hypothetical protein
MKKLLVSLGLCAALAACNSSSINRGKAGESCTSHNDCAGSLGCYNGICAATAPVVEEDGGTTAPSQEGESCTRRADCDTGLMCFDRVCMTAAPVTPADGGATNSSAGVRGETCMTNADCSTTLVCIPNPTNQSIGVCDVANYSITSPGGKSCSAECKVDLDCCELPIGESGVAADAGTVNYNSCADLKKALNQADPSGCEVDTAASLSRECFLFKTYCDCANNNPWKCNAGSCGYIKACTGNGEVIKGCPVQTRTGAPTISTCNAATLTCSTSIKAGCATNDDCLGAVIADVAGEKCVSGECVCATDRGACYRKCNVELDCAQHYSCDATKFVCTLSGECTTDLDCIQKSGDVTSVCAKATNTCRKPCVIDQDCGPSGVAGTKFKNLVCGADGYCADITGQCASDSDCAATAANGQLVKKFCVATTTAATVTYASAITATK